jgi:hypothetical protein
MKRAHVPWTKSSERDVIRYPSGFKAWSLAANADLENKAVIA